MLDSVDQCEQLRRFVDDWGNAVEEATQAMGDAEGGSDHPVRLQGSPAEELRLEDLAVTVNPTFNKLIVIFAHLATEIGRLNKAAEETLFPSLAIFGERLQVGDDTLFEGDLQVSLARALTQLQDVVLFIEHLSTVSHNLFMQLAALYGDIQRVYAPLQAVRLSSAFMALGSALGIAAGIDEAVNTNPALPSAFAMFKRMLSTVRADPTRFEAGDSDTVDQLEAALVSLENRLLPADCFSNVVDKLVVEGPHPQHFRNQIATTALTSLTDITSRLSSESERPSDRRNLIAVISLVALHARLVPLAPDKRLCKAAWDLVKNVIVLPVTGTVLLQPAEFLCSHMPPSAIALGQKEPLKAAADSRHHALDNLDASLLQEMTSLLVKGTAWLARLESSLPTKTANNNVSADLGPRVRLLSDGLFIAQRLKNLLQVALHLHVSLTAPMSKAELRLLAQIAELLQAIHNAYVRRNAEIALEAPHLLSFALGRLAVLVAPAKFVLEEAIASGSQGWSRVQKTLTGHGACADAARQDAVAAASLAEGVLFGPPTVHRLNLIRLCFDTLKEASVLNGDTSDDAAELIELAELIAEVNWHAAFCCDTSFLFFSRQLLHICLSDIYSRPNEAQRLPLLISAFRASKKLLLQGAASKELLEGFEAEMQLALDAEILSPLCTDIETDLRLHIHSARLTGVVEANPIESGVKDLSHFLRIPPFRLLSKQVNIRDRVIHYLNAAFHNHTAVSQHNWKTYGEMRNLAMDKYRISLAEIELPGQTLEQGLDVLEIMRNIHIFVARYNYNLNTQCFVEKSVNAKNRVHLNTISIRHVANSIRTHGTGITHTTINFVYQYLAQRFQIFSQFLYDDHIKSMLIKEGRALHDIAETDTRSKIVDGSSNHGSRIRRNRDVPESKTRTQGKQKYPVDRAMRFIRAVRQLGVTEDGVSFLDQFRSLITEIGNALGFVRMVRMGQQHYSTAAAEFIPVKGTTLSFESSAKAGKLTGAATVATKLLDSELRSLKESSTDGTDYFQTLIAVFSQLRSEEQTHLQNFYLSLPALMLIASEHLMHSKEKLTRRGKDGLTASFTDDGFPLGVAYILKVLDQEVAFDSLQWFESVTEHFSEERERVIGGYQKTNVSARWSRSCSEEESANAELRLGKLKGLADEMTLLQFSFTGARTFFNTT